MPIPDVSVMNRSLDNDYGTTRGPNAPASWELALYDGDPSLGGTELDAGTCPGYGRGTILPADWAPADGGAKTTTAQVALPAPTGAWARQAKWLALVDGDDHTSLWDCTALNEALVIGAAGGVLEIQPIVFYANVVEVPE